MTTEAERYEQQLEALGWGKPGEYAVVPNPITIEARALVRAWLRAKGVPATRANVAGNLSITHAWERGDKYICMMDGWKAPVRKENTWANINVDELEAGDPSSVEAEAKAKIREFTGSEARTKLFDEPAPKPAPVALSNDALATTRAAIVRAADEVLSRKIAEAKRELQAELIDQRRELERGLNERIREIKPDLSETVKQQIRDLANSAAIAVVAQNLPTRLEVHFNGTILANLEAEPRHEVFDRCLKWLLAGEHIYLVGPAGTGKTHLFKQLAKALGKKIFLPGQALSKYDISGHKGPTGEYFGTVVREALEFGGLLCIDEGDMWAAAALGFLNAPLANGWCAFPDKTIEVHKDFQCIIAANTWGKGATMQFQGRNPLDAASVDRFAMIFCDYDEKLERQIYGDGDGWTGYCHRVRHAVGELKLQHVISMRAIARCIRGDKVGQTVDEICQAALWRDLALDTVSKIKNLAGQPPQGKTATHEAYIEQKDYDFLATDFATFRDFVVSDLMVSAIRTLREAGNGNLQLGDAKRWAEQYRDGLIDSEELASLIEVNRSIGVAK